ncbi:MAG TPA: hypothetical protein VN841_06510 [Bryobacteraceae bacterium]|nr:hypothetical protein [Bryobacteraceae bacterium]
MPENPGNGHGQSRLDRLEGLMELRINDHLQFEQEHKKLLTAQVLLTERVEDTRAMIRELAESQRHSDERLNALIAVVDDLVRKRPPQP